MNTPVFPKGWKCYIPAVLLFLLMVLAAPRVSKFQYSYKKGAPWLQSTLVAQFDFPVLKTQEQLDAEKKAKALETVPYFRLRKDVTDEISQKIKTLQMGEYDFLRKGLYNIVSGAYAKGVISDKAFVNEGNFSREVIYVENGKRASKVSLSNIFSVPELRSDIVAYIGQKAVGSEAGADSLYSAIGLREMIVPNLTYDAQTSELIHKEMIQDISPTSGVVSAGTVIISEGEIVTAEILQMLDSYKAEYDKSMGYNGNRIFFWIGQILLCLLIVLIALISIIYFEPAIFEQYNRYLYLVMIIAIAAVATFATDVFGARYLYLIPYQMSALFLMAFFDRKTSLALYVVCLLPLLVFVHGGMELFVMFLFAGVVFMVSSAYFTRGWMQFLNCMFVFLALVLVYTVFHFVKGMDDPYSERIVLELLMSSLLTLVGYPLISLFEIIFKFVSKTRLQELCETSNPLLVELNAKAPGTFQHVLQVANMSEAISRAIGADPVLTRAGAMYHDIGKIANPLCFVENTISGNNEYHADLTPMESARDIIRHISDGEALADRYKLPAVVKSFISTHHGTTCTGYFYNTYLQQGGTEEDKPFFCYPGPNPDTKEQVVVMICDSVEAASRTINDFSDESVDRFIERIVDSKINDNQMLDSDISVKEINIIKRELKAYIKQLHHRRVKYPRPEPAGQPRIFRKIQK